MAGWLPAPPVRLWLIGLAILVVLISVPFAWHKSIGAFEFVRDWRRDWSFLFNKSDFGVLRYVHFLALAYLAWVTAGEGGARLRRSGLTGAVIGIVSRVGQQSLAVFAASMVMARVLGAFLSLAGGGWLAALAVNLAGFAVVIATARLAAFFKAKPWKQPASRPKPAGAAPLIEGLRP